MFLMKQFGFVRGTIVEIKDMLEMFYPNIILESFGPGTRRSLVGPHDERIIFG